MSVLVVFHTDYYRENGALGVECWDAMTVDRQSMGTIGLATVCDWTKEGIKWGPMGIGSWILLRFMSVPFIQICFVAWGLRF